MHFLFVLLKISVVGQHFIGVYLPPSINKPIFVPFSHREVLENAAMRELFFADPANLSLLSVEGVTTKKIIAIDANWVEL